MRLEAVVELQPPIEQADGAVVAADDDLPPAARAASDVAGDVLGDRALPGEFLLEELEFPPLVHLAGPILRVYVCIIDVSLRSY